jgi:hypothetical protein
MSEIIKEAEAARDKKGPYGEDIDLASFRRDVPIHESNPDLTCLSEAEREHLAGVGIVASAEERAGTFILKDHSPLHCSMAQEGVELLSIKTALERYGGLPDSWWKAVHPGTDKYTAQAALALDDGYFIRVRAGVKASFPVQACLFIGAEGIAQNIHNVVIAEPGSELHIITGCTTAPDLHRGLHVGVSEFFVQKGATVTSTMLHNWGDEIVVRPRTGVIVEEGATFMSNYVCLKSARSVQMDPLVRLVGPNAVTRLNTILVAAQGADFDVGGRVSLEAPGTRAEIISRTITTGGNIVSRGLLTGWVPGVKAHLECSGLILADGGYIRAIPELDGRVAGVEMSHEAAVGRISQEEIEYLMARGLSENEAAALIVRGFLNVRMEGLPKDLQDEIDRIVDAFGKSVF